MANPELNFQNILVLDLGQMGDVILSLPALSAIRGKFPDAKITVITAKAPSEILKIVNIADEIISVDRVKLRKSPKLWSIMQLFELVWEIRRRKFDFAIDLHSFYETNILGFLSGAKFRLFGNRENRSLDFLSNFRPKPPRENKSQHHADRYLAVVTPLGIGNADRSVKIVKRENDRLEIAALLKEYDIANKILVGFFLGAGHPTRRWNLRNFAELAERLTLNKDMMILAFLGPEERELREEANQLLEGRAILFDEMPLKSFFSALSFLNVLVCGDTGPMHLGAIVDVSIVLLSEKPAPTIFLPLTDKLKVLTRDTVNEISVDDVYSAVTELVNDHPNH